LSLEQAIKKLEDIQDGFEATEFEDRINSTLYKSVEYQGLDRKTAFRRKHQRKPILPSSNLRGGERNASIQPNETGEPSLELSKKIPGKIEIATETDLSAIEEIQRRKDPYKNDFIAPFDLFGVSAKFYIDGRTRTLTWMGCVCSAILVGTILTLFVLTNIEHSKKSESAITTFDSAI
jgi:hypothetical protein